MLGIETIGVIIFLLIWIWIIIDIYRAPLFDENEMPIEPKDKSILSSMNSSIGDIDSDLEAELLIYDEMMNNIKKRIICEVCLRQDDKMYTKYYSGMMGEVRFDSDDPDDEDHYIIELE